MLELQEGEVMVKPLDFAEATPGGGAPPPCPRCHGTGRERDGLDVDGKSWPCGLCNSGEPFERHCEDLGG